jgi:hypothetical protein
MLKSMVISNQALFLQVGAWIIHKPCRFLDFDPFNAGGGPLQAADGHMGGYEEGIFCQGSFNKRLSTGEVGVRIGPGSHPCRLFDFNGVMVEITETVEGLPLGVNADKLVPG